MQLAPVGRAAHRNPQELVALRVGPRRQRHRLLRQLLLQLGNLFFLPGQPLDLPHAQPDQHRRANQSENHRGNDTTSHAFVPKSKPPPVRGGGVSLIFRPPQPPQM